MKHWLLSAAGLGLIGYVLIPFVAHGWPERRVRLWVFITMGVVGASCTAQVLHPLWALVVGAVFGALTATTVIWPFSRLIAPKLPEERIIRTAGGEADDYVVTRVFHAPRGTRYLEDIVVPVCISLRRLQDPHDTLVWVELNHEGDSNKCALYLSFSGGLTDGVAEFLGWWSGTESPILCSQNVQLPAVAVPIFKRRADGTFVRLWPSHQPGVAEEDRIETAAGTLEFRNRRSPTPR